MHRRLCLAAFIPFACLAVVAWGDKAEKIHEGIVVSVTGDLIVMTDSDGKNEHSHNTDAATSITVDGKPAKLPDLAKGDRVKVAIDEDGKVVRIAATRSKK